MSTSTHGKSQESPLASRRIPSSNTCAVRSAELPSPNGAENSPIESVLCSEQQNYVDATQGELRSSLQENTLRQRRNIPSEKSNAGEDDETRKFCDATPPASRKLHGSTSSALKIESAHAPIDVKSSDPETSLGNVAQRVRLLSTLTTRAEQLREEGGTHLQRAQELREQIKAGELACGRMTQQVLEAQETIRRLTQKALHTREAIVVRKRHIKEDEEKLSQELRSRERKMEEVMSIVSQVNTIALETSGEISVGDIPYFHDSD